MDDLFTIIATQNPVEQEGTYKLPEAQLDRFLMKITMGYPSVTEEEQIMQLHQGSAADTYQQARAAGCFAACFHRYDAVGKGVCRASRARLRNP